MVILADDLREDLDSLFPIERDFQTLQKILIPSEMITKEDAKNILDQLEKDQEVVIS